MEKNNILDFHTVASTRYKSKKLSNGQDRVFHLLAE
jgi:hypothetical protein